MASFTDQKPRIATLADLKSPWPSGFRCRLCGFQFKEGDYWRWIFTNNSEVKGAHGNGLICASCDSKHNMDMDLIIEELHRLYTEFHKDKFWSLRASERAKGENEGYNMAAKEFYDGEKEDGHATL